MIFFTTIWSHWHYPGHESTEIYQLLLLSKIHPNKLCLLKVVTTVDSKDFPKIFLFSKCIWTPIWELPFIKYKSHYFVIKYHKQQYCCAYMLLPFPKMSSTPLKGCSAISLLYHITYTRVLTKFLFKILKTIINWLIIDNHWSAFRGNFKEWKT